MFPFASTVAAEACDELDRWRLRLDSKGPLSRAWEGRLRRDLEAEAIAASTSMEGVAVTVDEVRRILSGDRPTAVRPEDRALVEGYQAAMGFVLRRADDPDFKWDRDLLIGLHDRVLAGRYDLGAGRFRAGQRYLIDPQTGRQVFLPPPHLEVAARLDEMAVEAARSQDHPARVAAWIHLATAAIHPFGDGNGRTARVLAALAMYRGGFRRPEFTFLEEWWGRHLSDYYGAFRCLGAHFDPSADVTPFIEVHVRAQLSQVRALDLRERVERRLWTLTENLVLDTGLERRVANAVWDAFFERDVTAGYYRSVTDVSPATATHDLTAASAAGLLAPQGRRRGRRYTPGARLHALFGDGLGLRLAGVPGAPGREAIVGALTEAAIRSQD